MNKTQAEVLYSYIFIIQMDESSMKKLSTNYPHVICTF